MLSIKYKCRYRDIGTAVPILVDKGELEHELEYHSVFIDTDTHVLIYKSRDQ